MTWLCEWRHAPEARAEDFGEIWEKSVSWVLRSEEEGWLSLARSGLVADATTCWGGGRWKSQHRKIVPLSPYVNKPLNSKVIKSFVPELRNRKCFSCFKIPMFYVYIHFPISIFMYGYVTQVPAGLSSSHCTKWADDLRKSCRNRASARAWRTLP